MKKRMLSCALALLLVCALLALPAGAADFSDVPDGHWASSYIQLLTKSGVINGFPDGSYQPGRTLSRAQFLAMTARTLSNAPLPSANGSSWWTAAYEYAAAQGLISAETMPATSEAMNAPITRYEAAEILANSCQNVSGIKVTDFPDVSSQYFQSVQTATQTGLLMGYSDGTFGGTRTLTRAEAAAIITRLQARAKMPEGFHFVMNWGDNWLLECYDRDGSELRLVDILTGETRSRFALEMDMPEPSMEELSAERRKSDAEVDGYYDWTGRYRTLRQCSGDLVWGEAGLYRYADGSLRQLYAQGVCMARPDADGYLAVTHPAGVRVRYMGSGVNHPAGNQVVRINANGKATLLLDASGEHFNLTNAYRGEDGALYVEASEVWGMADLHVTVYRVADSKLTETDLPPRE